MGQDALNFVRYREDAGGDVSRTERQQTFVESIMDEASSMSSWSKIPEYVGIMGENFATDIPPSEMIEMAKAMMQGKNRSIYTHTLKGEGGKLASNGAWYYFADEEDVAKSKTLIEDWMNPAKSLAELTGTGASAADKQDVAGSGKDREVSTASAGADE